MSLHGNNWLFIHNPKCAGTTIKHIFSKYGERATSHSHAGLQDVPPQLRSKYTFAFVRNPFDRMVSAYEFTKKKVQENNINHSGWRRGLIDSQRPFKEWLMDSEFWEDGFRCNEIAPFQKRSQSYYISLDGMTIDIDYTGKVESFNSDMKHICSILEIPFKDVNINSNPHNPWKDYYDMESREWIEKYFKWDMETFGYEF